MRSNPWCTAFLSQIRTFGQLGRQGPVVTFGQKVHIWLKNAVSASSPVLPGCGSLRLLLLWGWWRWLWWFCIAGCCCWWGCCSGCCLWFVVVAGCVTAVGEVTLLLTAERAASAGPPSVKITHSILRDKRPSSSLIKLNYLLRRRILLLFGVHTKFFRKWQPGLLLVKNHEFWNDIVKNNIIFYILKNKLYYSTCKS